MRPYPSTEHRGGSHCSDRVLLVVKRRQSIEVESACQCDSLYQGSTTVANDRHDCRNRSSIMAQSPSFTPPLSAFLSRIIIAPRPGRRTMCIGLGINREARRFIES